MSRKQRVSRWEGESHVRISGHCKPHISEVGRLVKSTPRKFGKPSECGRVFGSPRMGRSELKALNPVSHRKFAPGGYAIRT